LWKVVTKEEKAVWEVDFSNHFRYVVREKQDCNHVFLSSEHLHSRVTKKSHIEHLYELLKEPFDEIEIIIFLKPQSTLAVSRYSTFLKSGKRLNDFFSPYELKNLYYDYSKFLNWWKEVFGQDALTLKILDDTPQASLDVVEEMCSILSISDHSFEALDSRKNVSLNAVSLDFLNTLNLYLEEEEFNMSNHLRKLIVNTIMEVDVDLSERKLPSRQSAINFDALYSESNELLAKSFNMHTPLFKVDYSRYPEVPVSISKDKVQKFFKQLVEIIDEQKIKSTKDQETWNRIKEIF